jgi:hypothetical protein
MQSAAAAAEWLRVVVGDGGGRGGGGGMADRRATRSRHQHGGCSSCVGRGGAVRVLLVVCVVYIMLI